MYSVQHMQILAFIHIYVYIHVHVYVIIRIYTCLFVCVCHVCVFCNLNVSLKGEAVCSIDVGAPCIWDCRVVCNLVSVNLPAGCTLCCSGVAIGFRRGSGWALN